MASPRPAPKGAFPRPQFATVTDAQISSVDWVVEPCWKGDRLLARLENGAVTLTDERGEPAESRLEEAARVLEHAIDADQAVIDGSWTVMPFVGEGSPARERAVEMAKETGSRKRIDPASVEPRRAFVAWDLVELDGQSLADIPYQERRRLLLSVIVEGIRVRVSPAVRMPIHGWLAAWRGEGFTHVVAKHANSRYRYGEVSPDWLQVLVHPERQPSIARDLLGRRRRAIRQVTDEPH